MWVPSLLVFAALLLASADAAGWAIYTEYGAGATGCDPSLAGEIYAYQLDTCIIVSTRGSSDLSSMLNLLIHQPGEGPNYGVTNTIYTCNSTGLYSVDYFGKQCTGKTQKQVMAIGCHLAANKAGYWSAECVDSFSLSDYAPAGSVVSTWANYPAGPDCSGAPMQYLIQPPKVCFGNEMYWCTNSSVYWTAEFEDAACKHPSQPAYAMPLGCQQSFAVTSSCVL